MRTSRRSFLWPVVAAAVALAGCMSRLPRGGADPMTQEEVDRLLEGARDPRTYFLTVYRDAEGAPVFVGANRQNLDRVVALDFAPIGARPLPVVKATVGKAETDHWALTDTTSASSWTGLDLRRALGLVPLGTPVFMETPAHVIDDVPGYLCVLPSLVLEGGLRLETVLLYARASHGSLWPLTRDPGAARAELVFGMDVLRSFAYVQWDFPRRRFVVSSARAYVPAAEAVLAAVPMESPSGALTVRGIVDGREQRILLDCAGDYEAVVETAPLGLLRQVSVGDLVLRQVRALPAREMGFGFADTARLGLGVLSRYRVTVDNRKHIVYFEAPAPP